MEWIVIECLACPVTGTFFSSVITEDNNWLILWLAEGALLQPGDVIEIVDQAMVARHKSENRTVYMICAFKSAMWKKLQQSTFCQGKRAKLPEQCSENIYCSFSNCPYGLRKV
jgi:hypothetical protein